MTQTPEPFCQRATQLVVFSLYASVVFPPLIAASVAMLLTKDGADAARQNLRSLCLNRASPSKDSSLA